MVGLMFADGTTASSNAFAIGIYTGAGGFTLAKFVGTLTNMTVTNIITDLAHHVASLMRLRLVWTASNTWAWAISSAAGPFTDFSSSTISATLTPTHFGPFVSSWSQAFQSVASFQYVRVNESDLSV